MRRYVLCARVIGCSGAISSILLSGCTEKTLHCTATVSVQVRTWCEPERWHVPIQVKLDGKVIAEIPAGSSSAGPFDYTNQQQGIELWVGQRKLGERPAACVLQMPDKTRHEFVLTGFSANLPTPQVLPGPCVGSECYEAATATRQRSCFQDLGMDTDPVSHPVSSPRP
jgi:hypothetical protein